jgi:2-keto-4-pentenoate hydratase
MLMSTKANRQAHQLMKARASGKLIAPFSETAGLNMGDAYDVARCLLDARIALGEQPVGRKISFSNQKLWPKYRINGALAEPIWSTLFEETVHFSFDNAANYQLGKAQQPRIESELVFKLSRAPAPDATVEELADCLEWMAPGLGIAVSPFPDWAFEAADAVAAFGLHRALIVGEPRMLSRHTRRNLPELLASTSVSLSRSAKNNTSLCAAGFGSDIPHSPVHALWNLHQQLQQQSQFSTLQAGEIVTTGSWTDAQPIARGEVWSSAFSQINVPGLHVTIS